MAGFDDIKDKNLLSGRGSDLLKSRQERINNKSVQEIRELEKIAQLKNEIDKLHADLSNDFDKKLAEITLLSKHMQHAKDQMSIAEKARFSGAEKGFKQATFTLTGTSSTRSDISAASRSVTNLGSSIGMAQSQSTGDLESYIESRKSLLNRQNLRIRDTASNIEGNESRYLSQISVRDRLISEIGTGEAALSAQKRLGIDTKSQYYRASDIAQQVSGEQERGAIRGGVAAGAFGSRKQVEEQLNSAAEKLIATFAQLDAAVKSGAKETGDLAKQFDSAEKEYRKQKDILSEMGKMGGFGGGGMQVAGGIIGNIGTIAQGLGQGTRYMGVTSELAQTQNRIGFANMANQRFTDAYGATQGDMAALRRVRTDAYSEQISRGLLLGGREDAAKLLETGGSGAKTIGTAIDAATSMSGMWAGAKGAMVGGPGMAAAAMASQGLAQATPDMLAFTQNITDYSKGITQGQTFLQSAQQQRALQDAMSQIGDFTSQSVFDQQKGLTLSSRGLGGGRGGVQAMLSDPAIVDMIARQAGLSGKDISGLTATGVSGLGGEFGRSGIGAVNDITRAGQLTRAGYLQSPEQMFQARSAMTGAGGGQQDFEEILKNAVANGMDNSKNIMQMVQATASLAGRSAGAGIAAFSGASEGLGRGIDALRGFGVSGNMATAAAARAAGMAEDVSASKDLDIANVIETARLRKDFGGASLQQLESMRTASPQELQELANLYKGGKTKEAEELAIKMGLHGQVSGAGDVAKIQEATREQVTRRATGFGINRQMEESIQEKMRNGQELSAEERSFMNGMTRNNLGRDVSGDALLGVTNFRRGASRGTLAGDAGGVVGSGEDTIRAGAMGDAKIFADGVENFNKAIGGLENLGSTMMKVSEVLKPDEFAKSVKDAATDFKIPTAAFGVAVKEFNTAVGDLVKALKNANNDMYKRLENQVNQNQGRKL